MNFQGAGTWSKSGSLMKCLDTDLLVAILRGKQEAQTIVEELDVEGKAATTSVNAFEVYFGANKSQSKNENMKETSKLLGRLEILPLDLASSRRAAEISAKLVAKGETIDFRDAMIAAIAVENGLTLVTRNNSHFKRIRELQIETW
jgi:tRNA(fMet)-specific endonuclease VapC